VKQEATKLNAVYLLVQVLSKYPANAYVSKILIRIKRIKWESGSF
jgi:hypothetical protein